MSMSIHLPVFPFRVSSAWMLVSALPINQAQSRSSTNIFTRVERWWKEGTWGRGTGGRGRTDGGRWRKVGTDLRTEWRNPACWWRSRCWTAERRSWRCCAGPWAGLGHWAPSAGPHSPPAHPRCAERHGPPPCRTPGSGACMERRGRWSRRAQSLSSSGFRSGQVIHRRKTCRKEQEAMSGSYALNFHLECSAHWGSLETGTRGREARFCASCLLLWSFLLLSPQLYTAVPRLHSWV